MHGVNLWHRHQWTETSRRFNPPDSELTQFRADSAANLMPVLYGITVVELHCTGCGDVRGVQYAGRAS